MPVAAVFDIRANLPALEAVLQDLRQEEVDQPVVGGDVLPGPMPLETIECLLRLDTSVHFVQGNSYREVLSQMEGRETDGYRISPEQWREPCARQRSSYILSTSVTVAYSPLHDPSKRR